MRNLSAKWNLFCYVLFTFAVLASLFSMVHAQAPPNAFNQDINGMVENELNARQEETKDPGNLQIFSTRVNNAQLGDTMYNMTNMIACIDNRICDPNKTVMGRMSHIMAGLYANPPASGLAYTHDVLANAGIIQPAYAQGIGFAALTPFLGMWRTTRNIAYAVLVLIMIGIGFMVIFRMKIDPKTIISVQAALPKIVLTLVLITFSYPIVGFLIDLMYIMMGVVLTLIGQGMSYDAAGITKLQNVYVNGDILTLLTGVFSASVRSTDDFLTGFWGLSGATGSIGWFLPALASISNVFGAFLGLLAPTALFALIIILGALFTFIRLLFLLLNAYIQILLSVIMGPLVLLTEAIPGRSAFTHWILTVIANLVVFPATAAVLVFAMFLNTNPGGDSMWTPPLLGIPGPAAGGKQFFNALLGMSVIFLSPTLVANIKKQFQPHPSLPITAGTALSPLTGGVQTITGAASQYYYFQQLGHGPLGKMPLIGKLFGGGGHEEGHGAHRKP